MVSSRSFIAALLVSSSLVMGACTDKNKSEAEKIAPAPSGQLTSKSVDHRDIEKLLKVPARKVKETEAQKALSMMGFDDQGGSATTWDSRKGNDGNYSFKNLRATSKNGENLKIGKLELTGVHMDGEDPSFDRMDIENLSRIEGDKVAELSRLSLSRPAPAMASTILYMLQDLEEIEDMNIDLGGEDGQNGFGAILVEGLNMASEDSLVTIKTFGWGEDSETKKSSILLEDLKGSGLKSGSGRSVAISIKSISAAGINHRQTNTGNERDGVSKFNPFINGFENWSLRDLNIDVDTLNIASSGMSGVSSTKNGTTRIEQSVQPIVLSFTGPSEDRSIRNLQNMLTSMDMETLSLSAESTTLLNEEKDSFEVSNGYVGLKDGFDLNFSYKGTGIGAVSERLNESGSPSDLTDSEVDDILSQLSLSELSLALTDKSIVDKSLAFIAKQRRTTPKSVKLTAKIGLMALGFAAKNESQGEALADIGAAFGRFIDEGGTLTVNLNPETSVPVSDLKNLNASTLNPKELGFSITHQSNGL